MRRAKKPPKGMSSMKKCIIFVCLGASIMLFLEVRARFIYGQLQGDGGEDEEGDEEGDDVYAAPPAAVDVYALLQEPGNSLVASRFQVQELLGTGFVSHAYSGIDMNTQERVVLKFTHINVTENTSPTPLKVGVLEGTTDTCGSADMYAVADTGRADFGRLGIPDNVSRLKLLQREYATYQSFRNTRLLQSFFYGEHKGFKVLVTQQGGKSLIQHQEMSTKWSREDVYQIARNIIWDLEQLHGKSFIHNDMHTGNIAFKKINETSYQVNLIDFNGVKKYRDSDTLQHLEQKRNFFRVPIHRFSPPCYFEKKTCSRRDDLFSLGYMLVMLASEYANCSPLYVFTCPGERKDDWFGPPLPWAKVTGKQNLIDFMTSISLNILKAPDDYHQQLPDNFRLYFEHLESLQFTSKPDYAYLADLFLLPLNT